MDTFEEYQVAAKRTARDTGFTDRNLSVAALGLTGEAGEFADHVKKYLAQGHKLDLEQLRAELGDVLWYVMLACEVCGLRMCDVAGANIEKLKRRYPDGFAEERSVNRNDGADPRQMKIEGT